MKEQWVGVYSTRGLTIEVVREIGEVKSPTCRALKSLYFILRAMGAPKQRKRSSLSCLKYSGCCVENGLQTAGDRRRVTRWEVDAPKQARHDHD